MIRPPRYIDVLPKDIDPKKEYQGYRNSNLIYSEHNDNYLKECLDNLRGKGIIIDFY